jgi:small-conductance mechanosensitive channel
MTMTIDWVYLKTLIDPSTGIGAIVVALILIAISWISCFITTRFMQKSNWFMGRLKRRVDETVIRYISRIKNFLIFLIAGFIYVSIVPSLRALMGTMLAGAGITALILGFAAKSTLSNFISGISLAIYRPLRIGDKVMIDDEFCTVEDITMRHTIARTWQNKRIIIPNSTIDEMTLVNYSIINQRMKCTVEFGVSYDTDIDFARRLILEEANRCPYRKEKPEDEPDVRVISHGDFSIGLRLYLWVPDADAFFLAKFWMLEQVKKRFDQEGVEIPFPYRTVVYKKDLPPPRKKDPSTGKSM